MGILGGIQVLRAQNKNNLMDPDLEKPLLHSILPLAIATKTRNSPTHGNDEFINDAARSSSIWKRRVDFNALVYAGLLGFLTCTTYLIDVQFPYSQKIKIEGNSFIAYT